jgi:pimeloyl-ACP methyl ester carboxylesterase
VIRIGDNVNGAGNRADVPVRPGGRALQRASSDQETLSGVRWLPGGRPSYPTLTGTRFSTRSRDGVELSGVHVPGPAGGPAFVIGHGFTHGVHKPATRAVMAAFTGHGGVVAADFRGHGRSGGRSTVGRDETFDLDAAVSWARSQGYGPVTVVGFSMGAAVALRQSALGAARPDAAVAVSAPSRWYMRESIPMRKVHWLLETPFGPMVGRSLGVRLGEPWFDLPASPVEAVADITCPLLLIHGASDPYFNPLQARALQRASRAAELWIEPGMGHGETATTPALADRIAAWSVRALSR